MRAAALRQRFQRKRGSLAEAIAEDARLAGMTEAEITADVRRKVRCARVQTGPRGGDGVPQ
jgi:hypothetical protein